MRDKNYSLFISLLKLVNFNNTFALLLYFFLCQDTSGNMFLSIRQNKFAPKFNFCVIRQIKFRQITSLLRSAKLNSAKLRHFCDPPKFLPLRYILSYTSFLEEKIFNSRHLSLSYTSFGSDENVG